MTVVVQLISVSARLRIPRGSEEAEAGALNPYGR